MVQAHFTRAWISWPKLVRRSSNWRKLGVGTDRGGGRARVSRAVPERGDGLREQRHHGRAAADSRSTYLFLF